MIKKAIGEKITFSWTFDLLSGVPCNGFKLLYLPPANIPTPSGRMLPLAVIPVNERSVTIGTPFGTPGIYKFWIVATNTGQGPDSDVSNVVEIEFYDASVNLPPSNFKVF